VLGHPQQLKGIKSHSLLQQWKDCIPNPTHSISMETGDISSWAEE